MLDRDFFDAVPMRDHEARFGENSRFISNPGFSEDQEPDPELAGLWWDEIVDELDRLEWTSCVTCEAWEQKRLEQMWLAENDWYMDF